MAIKKEITKDSGIKVKYHKIKSIVINKRLNKCSVVLEEYIDDSYRNKIKEAIKKSKDIEALYELAGNTEDENTRNTMLEKANNLAYKNIEDLNTKYFIDERIIDLEEIPEDTTVSGFYKELMKLKEFKSSKEV